MTLTRAVRFLKANPARWLLAAVMGFCASQTAAAPSVSSNAPPAQPLAQPAKAASRLLASGTDVFRPPPVPKPASARRRDLPAALTKIIPSSVADLRAIEQHVKALVARVSPAVVAVEVGDGSGSGVIISSNGLVLTAGHVCGRPNRDVRFTFPDGRTARGKTLGVDLDSDTGLMRITTRGTWPHVPVGDLEQARDGDWVLALGHPGGFDPRRSLVVRLGRLIGISPDMVQTDCTISPGDSGGPLIDMHGRVIGIHSFISDSAAANYHVPISSYYDTWTTLAKGAEEGGPPSRPAAYVGAKGTNDAGGCRLTVVEPNSPAAKAGLKVGDLVLKVDGRDIKVSASFQRWIAEAEPGDTLSLDIKRGDQLLSVEVKPEPPRRRR